MAIFYLNNGDISVKRKVSSTFVTPSSSPSKNGQPVSPAIAPGNDQARNVEGRNFGIVLNHRIIPGWFYQ